jgi:hypothetical protein
LGSFEVGDCYGEAVLLALQTRIIASRYTNATKFQKR